MHKKQYALLILLVFILHSAKLFATPFVACEVTVLCTVSLVAGYERDGFSLEIGAQGFALEPNSKFEGIYKIQTTKQLYKNTRSSFSIGLGLFWYPDDRYEHFTLAGGPACTYAYKLSPRKNWELTFGLLLPVLFYDNYKRDPNDDFPGPGAFDGIMLILSAPTVGLRYRF